MKTLYFLPGRGARLTGRLGAELARRGYHVEGRTLHDGFELLPFDQQVDQIRKDLTERNWHSDNVLVAHSYGAHLCLSALADLPSFPGILALVSPAFQSVRHEFNYYRVPNAKPLMRLIEAGAFPKPDGAVGIVSGREDWQVPAPGLEHLARALGTEVQWADRGHDLGPEPVQALLDHLGI